jgi:hypothetical protein
MILPRLGAELDQAPIGTVLLVLLLVQLLGLERSSTQIDGMNARSFYSTSLPRSVVALLHYKQELYDCCMQERIWTFFCPQAEYLKYGLGYDSTSF